MVQREIGLFNLEIMPNFGINPGNVFTYASGGTSIRFGWRIPEDYGTPRIQPSIPGSSYFSTSQFGIYTFAGVEGRAVARNIFLDGNSFRDGLKAYSQDLIRLPINLSNSSETSP